MNPGCSVLQSLTSSSLQFLQLRLPFFLLWEQELSEARGYGKKVALLDKDYMMSSHYQTSKPDQSKILLLDHTQMAAT